MIIELEINGARVIISGDNLTVNVTDEDSIVSPPAIDRPISLKEWLRNAGITQAEFADRIGSHQVNLNRFINGKRRPSWAMIMKITQATGGAVNVSSWLDGASS